MTTPAHPTEAQLLLHRRRPDRVTEAHLSACVRCRRIVPESLAHAFPSRLPSGGVSTAVLDLLGPAVPRPADPAASGLWRLEWDGEVVLAIVVRATDAVVTALAVDSDPPEDDADDRAVDLPPGATVLGAPLRAWPAAAVAVPRIALDRLLDARVQIASADNDLRPEAFGLGRALRQFRAFARHVEQALADEGEAGAVGALLKERGITRQDLVALGFDRRDASLLLQDRRMATEAELRTIATAMVLDLDELRAASGALPGALLAELHLPYRRAAIEQRAIREGVPGPVFRRHAAAQIAAPVAARQARGAAPIDWSSLVDAYLSR